ncbi:helix-turn-helix domain-containing protein [Burkholderia multivorans]|nr:helix-turn-helix domain-containing protein [Burkholderia multivorans]MCA8504786.1 helix-turn-helix domain-containing protein [Burkholderia multivorans]MDN8083621.1 helix-turn-helix domain-containing protein [Burkholderia multivorans]
MNWAWEQRLPPNSKLILMALADAADEVGQCWPRVRLIAEKCCTSERTVQRVLKELEATGFLQIERNYRKDGSQSSNIYSLNLTSAPDRLSPPSDKLALEGDMGVSPPVTRGTPPSDRVLSPHESPTRTINESSLQLPVKVTHKRPHASVPCEGGVGASDALVWPSQLNGRERNAIAAMVGGLNVDDAQMLLDELAGVMATKSVKTNRRYNVRTAPLWGSPRPLSNQSRNRYGTKRQSHQRASRGGIESPLECLLRALGEEARRSHQRGHRAPDSQSRGQSRA